jgi:hypothetical protein
MPFAVDLKVWVSKERRVGAGWGNRTLLAGSPASSRWGGNWRYGTGRLRSGRREIDACVGTSRWFRVQDQGHSVYGTLETIWWRRRILLVW